MERESMSIEDISASTQDSINDFYIRGSFRIIGVRKKIARNGTSYYSLNLKHKTGKLNAKRFTNGDTEFESLNTIYLVGNNVEIEGVYQYEWHSMKINTEKLIGSVIKEFSQKNQDHIDKLDELIILTQFGTTIQIKSYINDVINSYFNKASNKKAKEFKKFIGQYMDFWPKDRKDEICNEYYRTIERYEDMQQPRWKKWGSRLIQLISVIR